MESAIPDHLLARCPRSSRVALDYTPPYPAYSARFAATVSQVVMAYIGIQHRGPVPAKSAHFVSDMLRAQHGPRHVDHARYVDAHGLCNTVSIGYWESTEHFDAWRSRPQWSDWWNSADRLHEPQGYFMEVIQPRAQDYETLFTSQTRPEGITNLCTHMSGPVQQHAYWGSARERIPASQTRPLEATGRLQEQPSADGSVQRVRVIPHDNLCLIRSGQDWTDAEGRERELYLAEMEPVLREAMDFLRDSGREIGCYSCRYMDVIDAAGSPLQKRFGLASFRSIADMERWSESHPTHVAIFGTFMRLVQELQGQLKTQFYHEVSVVRAADQFFEYLNCHADTGLLRAARTSA